MKRVILIFIVAFQTFNISAQTKDDLLNVIKTMPFDKNGFLTYQIVDSIKASKSDLFFYATSFVIDKFNSPNDVIQMNDSIRGVIAGTARTSVAGESKVMLTSFPYKYDIPYKFKIQVKDNKYKIEIYGIEIGIDGYYGPVIKESSLDIPKQSIKIMHGNYIFINDYFNGLLYSIRDYMHNKTIKKNDNW